LHSGLHFPDDIGTDSLDAVEIVMAYEEAFDEEISEQEMKMMQQFRTKKELLDYLRNRKKGGHII
jgi:acyl carrier protein